MSNLMIAFFDHRADAESAARLLEADGISPRQIEIVTQAEAGGVKQEKGFLARLFDWDVPEQHAHVYAEGVRRGGTILRLHIDEALELRARTVLEESNAVDIEQREEAYRGGGWSGFDSSAPYFDERSAAEERARYGSPGASTSDLGSAAASLKQVGATSEQRIPVVEEQLAVGKRAVERGGVRIRTYTVETPVSETLRLQEEHVTVERRAPTSAANEVPAEPFKERTIEMTETAEEPVIGKRAQVREEVVVRKDVEERAENVTDTVRHTEVEVEDSRGRPAPAPDGTQR